MCVIAGRQKIIPIEVNSKKNKLRGVLSKFKIRLDNPIEVDLPSIKEAIEKVRNFGRFKLFNMMIEPNAEKKSNGPKT
jgi:hypothetical protein